eukprot:TRINITY_DN3336_c0_g1_i2.p1 TRINITY_DN3336_c0_g1~~TRINITY_DN3336_c0_g1_i2.p1  ORF type:complete len:270 (+),score=92.63 TRINITY_DN3336_c0_g1_i2:925-1734(+)
MAEVRVQKVDGRVGCATRSTTVQRVADWAVGKGLKEGMVIRSVCGREVRDGAELRAAFRDAPDIFTVTAEIPDSCISPLSSPRSDPGAPPADAQCFTSLDGSQCTLFRDKGQLIAFVPAAPNFRSVSRVSFLTHAPRAVLLCPAGDWVLRVENTKDLLRILGFLQRGWLDPNATAPPLPPRSPEPPSPAASESPPPSPPPEQALLPPPPMSSPRIRRNTAVPSELPRARQQGTATLAGLSDELLSAAAELSAAKGTAKGARSKTTRSTS